MKGTDSDIVGIYVASIYSYTGPSFGSASSLKGRFCLICEFCFYFIVATNFFFNKIKPMLMTMTFDSCFLLDAVFIYLHKLVVLPLYLTSILQILHFAYLSFST